MNFLLESMMMKVVLLLLFLRRWCNSNVMLFNNKYIQKSLSSSWGKKNKALPEILIEHFIHENFELKVLLFWASSENRNHWIYCLWLTHDLSHVTFLIFCPYPIKFFLFSNYPISFNVLRHVMKFCNSAVLRLGILSLLHLDYLCVNIHSCSAL